MVEERLEAGEQEHQSCIEIALPKRSIFIPHETQKKTGKKRLFKLWYETMDSPSEALAFACFIYSASMICFFLPVICYYLILPLQTVVLRSPGVVQQCLARG